MGYEPKEGVDYIVDLYAITGASPDAPTDELKQALNERTKEYHPDRLEGTAPEFRHRGERMAVLLNRARSILLDDGRRAEYDEILEDWDGPLSTDGNPVITVGRAAYMSMVDKTPEEVEAIFTDQVTRIETVAGYKPGRLAFIESLIEKSKGDVDDALRAEYEDALLQKDRVLAIQEAERSSLLGLPDIEESQYVATLDYGQKIEAQLVVAKTEHKEQLQAQALGGVGARLALLTGESDEELEIILAASTSLELPKYFEDQASAVVRIAQEREDITARRLANFSPDYPESDLQTEFREDVAIGIAGSLWIGAKIDSKDLSASVAGLPADIKTLLEQDDIATVIEKGFNVLTIELREQLDTQDLIAAALEKYIDKYGLGSEGEVEN